MKVLPIVIAFFAFLFTSVLSVKAMGDVYSFKEKVLLVSMVAFFMTLTCVDFEFMA